MSTGLSHQGAKHSVKVQVEAYLRFYQSKEVKESQVKVRVKIRVSQVESEAYFSLNITALTTTEQLHHQPQFILHHKGGIVRHDVRVVALAHSLDLFLHRGGNMGYKVTHKEQKQCSAKANH